MRKILCILVIVVCSLFTISCSTNTQKSETDIFIEEAEKKWAENDKIIKEDLAKKELYKLEIQDDVNSKVEGNYMYITGSVKNIGKLPIQYYEVLCKFKDKNGQVLDSDFTNSNLLLLVGEMQKFEIMHKWDEKYETYDLYVENIN